MVLRDAVRPSGDIDTATLVRGLLQLRNTPDQDTGLSPAQLLLGRDLRDFLPSSNRSSPIKHARDLRRKWQEVAEWRELALAPRQARIHDKLVQGTKELTPLVIGDHVMIQNQLGNKPRRWDKRGVVVQADPAIRQYKVMTFGSRRLTMRNRKFLRKYNPVSVPEGTPTGLPAGYKQLIMRLPVVDKQHTPMGNQDSPAPKPSQPSDHSPTIQGYDLPLPPAIVEKYTPPPVQLSTAWPVNHSSSHVTPAPALTPETVQPDTPLVAPACGPDQSVLRRSERPGRFSDSKEEQQIYDVFDENYV